MNLRQRSGSFWSVAQTEEEENFDYITSFLLCCIFGFEGRPSSATMADDGDIEYYIKFPTPATQSSSLTRNSTVDDFVLVHNESKPPVIVLLGWAGCQDKHLAKYSALYEDKGCVTVRCTAPLSCLFLRHGRMRALGRRLLGVLLDLQLHEHPVFFHVFSNGGAYLYKHVMMALREREQQRQEQQQEQLEHQQERQEQQEPLLKVSGVVWDSAPGKRRLRSIYLALKAILETPGRLGRGGAGGTLGGALAALAAPIAMTLAVLITAWWFLEVVVRSALSLRPQPMEPLAELADLPPSSAQLFLYSRADKLIHFTDVLVFSSRRYDLGEEVTLVPFEDSPHVQHYMRHREAYTIAVIEFLKDVLSGRRRSPRPSPGPAPGPAAAADT